MRQSGSSARNGGAFCFYIFQIQPRESTININYFFVPLPFKPKNMRMSKKSKSGTGPTDPKKKNYEIKTSGGGYVKVSEKAVKDARANKGVFKERPAYKGKLITDDKGNMTGIKKNDGTFVRATNPVERYKVRQELKRDRKLHVADSTAHSRIIKTFQEAKIR